MKIAVIIDTWFPAIGGGQINALEISKRIAKKGHQVDIITRNNGSYKPIKVKNLQVFRLDPRSKPDDNLSRMFFLIKALFFLNNKDYDVVHLQAFLPGLLSPPIRFLLKKPTVFTVHGTRMFEEKPKKSFGFLIEKIILTRIKYNVQISVTKAFSKFKNVNKKIVNIPNGLDISKFKKVKAQKTKYPKILWVGRFDPVKRVEDLLSAMQIIKKEIPDAKLTIVGYGKDEKKLKNIKEGLKLTNVEFVGQREGSDLIKEYKSAHLFVLPSASEGQPLSILEALACKLPIVASNVGGVSEILQGTKDSILVPSLKPEKLASAIVKALRNLNRIKGKDETILKLSSWRKAAGKTMSVYRTLLQ